MRRPSFQFYPSDWQGNARLRRCTHAEKGIWIDIMCLLHDSDEYGILRWPLADIAHAIGASVPTLRALCAKQVIKGGDVGEEVPAFVYRPRHAGKDGDPITLIPVQPGPLWFSSRMVRDEYVRTLRATKGQEAALPKGGIGGVIGEHLSRARVEDEEEDEDKEVTPKYNEPFNTFWAAYPLKVGKPAAYKAWKRQKIGTQTLAAVMDGLTRACGSPKWHEESGKYIPHPRKWLNERRWEDEHGSSAPAHVVTSDGLCHCGALGLTRSNGGQWLCAEHREAA